MITKDHSLTVQEISEQGEISTGSPRGVLCGYLQSSCEICSQASINGTEKLQLAVAQDLLDTINAFWLLAPSGCRVTRTTSELASQSSKLPNHSSECNRAGSDDFHKYSDNTISKHKVSAGQIASNFKWELIAIRTALDIYLTWTNIANSNVITVLLNCRSALESIKEGKMGVTSMKSIIFCSPLVHWANHVPSSGS
ncbi:RNase H domain-containing protein [Trichonephila clavipes]|nr:RNase H domain-containing protein [Trichonephila clavipes]